MDLKFTEEQERWKKEVRDFLDEEIKKAPQGYFIDDMMSDIHATAEHENWRREFTKRVGAKGWISMGWPKKYAKYGGRNASQIERAILDEEFVYHGVALVAAAGLAGPIMRHGSEELQEEFLPRIATGEISCWMGRTEADAGSEWGNLTTRAVKQPGGDYIVNGHKMFASNAHRYDYGNLLVITDPSAERRNGLSRFIVDMKSPGVTVKPLITMVSETHRENQVFFDDVRIPARYLLGVENQAWTEMNQQRGMGDRSGHNVALSLSRKAFHDFVQYCRETKCNGHPLSEDPLVRHKLAELGIELEVMYYLHWASIIEVEKGYGQLLDGEARVPDSVAQTIVEIMKREWTPRFAMAMTQIVGPLAQIRGNPISHLQEGAKWAPVVGDRPGWIERYYRVCAAATHRDGSAELRRMIVATRALGLPR